jgi:hypothetical protein
MPIPKYTCFEQKDNYELFIYKKKKFKKTENKIEEEKNKNVQIKKVHFNLIVKIINVESFKKYNKV